MTARVYKGRKAHKSGHLSEYVALIHLMLTGHHILGFRLKAQSAEIDILAVKGKRLCLIEVKQRRTIEEALEAVSPEQQNRLWQAGLRLQAQRPNLRSFDLGLDLYVLAPGRLPRHIKNAFEGGNGR